MKRLRFALLSFLMLLSGAVSAQISGVINDYTEVTNLDVNNIEVTVADPSAFSVGDRALLIQMNGASIDETNTATFGDLSAANGAGSYELLTICNIAGNDIAFEQEFTQPFDVSSGQLQLVTVPQYNNENVLGTLTCDPWNGTDGGVVVLEATGTLTLNANIDASGTGFAGGSPNAFTAAVCDVPDYFDASTSTVAAGKGQGVAALIASKENGRGKQATGGGGANSWSAGGAGGGNGGTGGSGGDNYNGASCNGDPVGGVGGLALAPTVANPRVFLGGGGGAGHNSGGGTAQSGGAGGGIIIIVANAVNGNGFTILSNGANGGNATGGTAEGSGGAGAGGTIVLDVKTYTNNLVVQANGGDGGDNGNPSNCYGPGGGGGGGFVWSTGQLPINVFPFATAGDAGDRLGGPAACVVGNYGATDGANGTIINGGFAIPIGGGPTAGSDGVLTVCDTETSVDLETGLTSVFDAGGTWNDDNTTGALTGQFFDASAVSTGTYSFTYTVTQGVCADSSATVTVNVTNFLNAGTNNAISVCDAGGLVDLFASLGGAPDAGGTWTDNDGTGALTNDMFDPSGVVAGSYDFTYSLTGQGACASSSATVTVDVNAGPNAGNDALTTICEAETSFDLTSLLGSFDGGGLWVDNDGSGALTGNVLDASIAGVGTYSFTYIVAGVAPCVNDSAEVVVTVAPQPNAGVDGALQACTSNANVDLFTGLTGSPDIGGSWLDDDATGALNNGFFDPSQVVSGTYSFSYVVFGLGACGNDSSTVLVTVTEAPNAGSASAGNVCSANNAVDLFTLLGGTPGGGGSWSDDDGTGAMSGGIFDATAVALGTYDFTYSLPASGPCPGANATVTVTVVAGADAGIDGTTTACANQGTIDLFAQLGGTPNAGGSWSDDDATGALNSGFLDPSMLTTGTYDFTYIANSLGTCPDDTSMVSVTITEAPNAGSNGALSVCIQNTNVDLFTALLGTPDAGGTWIDDDNTGAVTAGVFDASQVATGTYGFTYVVIGTAPCANDSASVNVIVTPGPDAGTNGTLDVCGNNSAVDLFSGLGGAPTPGGTWNDNDATGALSGGFFNAGAVAGGTYNFTYIAAVPGCDPDSAVVTVNVTAAPDAGNSGAVTVCNSVSNYDLFGGLGGTPDAGGTWVDNDGTGALAGSTFDASAVANGAYTFTYIVNGTAPCAGASATVLVSVVTAPDAGADGALTVCSTDNMVDLFMGLTGAPAQGGTWIDDDATGALNGTTFDASITGAGTFDFSYTVPAVGCPDDTATATITVIAGPNAGSNGVLNTCQSVSSLDLFSGLGGTPDLIGSWNDDDATGQLTGSIFDPSAVTQGSYSFTYTVNGTAPCVDATSTVVVNVQASPNAGQDSTLSVCDTELNIALYNGLGGTPDLGGVWNDDDATGGLNGSSFDASTVTAGTYNFTYIVTPAGCPSDSALVAVTVTEGPDAGSNQSVQVCETETSFDLFANLGGTPETGGTWNDDDATGALSGSIFDPSQVAPGLYSFTYSVAGVAPCTAASASVFVIVTAGPNAGNDSTLTACNNDGIVDLFSGLGGTFDGFGTWSDDDATGALNGSALNAAGLTQGNYDFTYVVDIQGCTSDSALVTVTVVDGPDAGQDNTLNVCNLNNAFTLTSGLSGTPDAGGTWTDDDNTGAVSGGVLDATSVANGTYQFTYTVTGSGACPTESAVLIVNIIDEPNAGTTGQLEACNSNQFIDLFAGLGGTPDSTGVWSDNNNTGALNGWFVDGTLLGAGNYAFSYEIEAAGCASAQASVLLVLEQNPVAGADTSASLCEGDSLQLWTLLDPAAHPGGTWNDVFNSGGLADSTFYSSGLPNNTYLLEYTISGGNACPDATAQININVENQPYAGIPDSLEVCSVPVDLFSGLSSDADNTGNWGDDDGTGLLSGNIFDATTATPGTYHFTYTVSTTGCGSDASTVVVVACDNTGTVPVPEGFSPNNDGVNDFLVIDGIFNFPNNNLTVFNRWGNIVYQAAPYDNSWNGLWDNESRAGEGLPIGTYFYVLDLGNGSEPITGYIYLNR